MDQNTALQVLRELSARIVGQEAAGQEISPADAAALAVRFEGLDRRLTAGDSLPDDWCTDGDRR